MISYVFSNYFLIDEHVKSIDNVRMLEKKNNIYDRVKGFIQKNDLFQKNDKIILSLSAGKDSMALLDIMIRLKSELNLEIFIFHLNHMMREDESDEDEKFLIDIAGRKGIEIIIERYDFKNRTPRGSSFEKFAREKRYELIKKVSGSRAFQKIVTSHSRDDNIETIVMRIFRGTGVHGLNGIGVNNDNIVRPLLFLSSEEIYSHLRKEGISWREDSSNSDNKYLRNHIRNNLLPQIYERFGAADRAILVLREISGDFTSMIDDLLFERYGDLYFCKMNQVYIELDRYINDRRIFNYVLAKAIRDSYSEYVNHGMLQEIYRKVKIERTNLVLYENRNFIIKKTLYNNKKFVIILRYSEKKEFVKWEYRVDLKKQRDNELLLKELNTTIKISLVDYSHLTDDWKNSEKLFIDPGKAVDFITIRNRLDGDRIQLENGSKKIKDLMIEKKLDKHTKDMIPLLIINSQVAAFMGRLFGDIPNRVSIDYYIKSNSKKIIVIQKICC